MGAIAADVVDGDAEDRIVFIEYQAAILRDGQLRAQQVIDRVVAVEAKVLYGLDDLSGKSGAARVERSSGGPILIYSGMGGGKTHTEVSGQRRQSGERRGGKRRALGLKHAQSRDRVHA